MKSAKQGEGRRSDSDPFELAGCIVRQLNACAEKAAHAEYDGVKRRFLWIRMVGQGPVNAGLSGEDWLNVVDEAASLGVSCLMVTIDGRVMDWTDTVGLCHWAQKIHRMSVGLHLCQGTIDADDLEALEKLERDLTCVVVPTERCEAAGALLKGRFDWVACSAPTNDTPGPCDYARELVFVDPTGHIYFCGTVEGDDRFLLGDVFERSMGYTVDRAELLQSGDHGVLCRCSACPSRLAREVENLWGEHLAR